VNGSNGSDIKSRLGLTAGPRIGLGVIVVAGLLLNLSNVPGLLGFLPNAVVGSILVIRRPHNLIGWLLLLMAACFSLVALGSEATAAVIGAGWAPWLPMLAWLRTMAAVGLFAGWALLSAIFPTGTLAAGGIGRMTRAALALVVGISLLAAVGPSFQSKLPDGTTTELHNPIGIAPDWPGWSFFTNGLAFMVMLGAILVCTVGLLIRFRRAGGTERQQYKWLLASLAFIVMAVLFGYAAGALVDPDAGWIWTPAIVAFPLPPIAVGIAILRYRLYEIDRIISRTIAYGVVTVFLFVVFASVNLGLQAALGDLSENSPIVVALSTLSVAALFQPLRRRVQAFVDRRFARARYDAERTVRAFVGRLHDETDMESIMGDLARTAQQAIAPTTMTVWLRHKVPVR
jgi:hypothetical protein